MNTETLKTKITQGLKVFTISLLMGCASETTTNNIESADTLAMTPSLSENDKGFYDIPSPVQQVELLQKAGAVYKKDLLNPLDNISKYSTSSSMALNLGVYGADMSYAAVFNQQQDAILYLDATKKLADGLKIKGDFYSGVMLRMGRVNNNKDSLLQIVSDVYRLSNESLKETDQSHLSALVVAGSFVEALYIGTQGSKNVENKEAIYKRIGEFKGSLSNLVALISTVHDGGFEDILSDLRSIKAIYDEKDGTKISEEQIVKISKQVKAIRIRITNP